MKKNKKVAYLNVFHIITNFVIFSICVLFVPSFLFESKIVYRSFGGFFRYPNDINSSSDTYVSQMNLDKAWDIATGFDLYTIGVIDSGINNSSLDFAGVINTSFSYDCSGSNRSPFDDLVDHGTCVAGIIGSKGHNNTAKSGVMWTSKIASLRCDNPSDYLNHLESPSAVINAVNRASQSSYYMPILNFSGGFGHLSDVDISNDELEDLAEKISLYNGLLVCSAGNGGSKIGSTASNNAIKTLYPQMLNLDNILVVGGLNDQGGVHYSSNYSNEYVDIYAPFSASTVHCDGSVNPFQGTSCSSPLVAGVAGLILSINPSLSMVQVKSNILNSADYVTVTDINSPYYPGYKVLNAYNAVLSSLPSSSVLASTIYSVMPLMNSSYHTNYNWYRIDAIPGQCTFNMSATNNFVSAELYSDIQSSPIASSSNTNGPFSLSYDFYSSGTYYLKVINNSNIPIASYSISISRPHTHTYSNAYLWRSGTKHLAICSCGSSALRVHAVASGGNTCLLCGGPAFGGIVGPVYLNLNDYQAVGLDSFMKSDEIIILGPIDLERYLNGELNFEEVFYATI